MSPFLLGILSFPLLFFLLAIGVPIGLALIVTGGLGCVLVIGFQSTISMVTNLSYYAVADWALVVLPMFLLLGNFAFHAGVGADAFTVARAWLGRIRGGLAMTTTSAAALFSFASGSHLATSAMFTRIALPEMQRAGYDNRIACGSIAAAGTLAALIPPSALMVLYTIFTGVSLGALIMAGIIPGLLTAGCFLIVLFAWTRIKPAHAPAESSSAVPLKEKTLLLGKLVWIFIVIAAIIGGIYMGVFTPMEAGAAGAAVAFVMLLIRRGFKLAVIRDSILSAVNTLAMIFLILVGALLYARFLAYSGIISSFTNLMTGWDVSPVLIVIIMLALYLILGTFMEALGLVALTIPVFFPIVTGLGIDGVWFGILIIMMIEVGTLTPPVGTIIYTVKATAGESVRLEEIFIGVAPFFLAFLVAAGLIILFPQIALWLPGTM